MTADPNVGEDGLTPAGRQAAYDKAVAAAKANGLPVPPPPPSPAATAAADQAAAAARDQTAGQSRTAKATAARRANAAARRAGKLADTAAAATEAAAARVDPGPQHAQAAPEQAAQPPQAAGPCEPCLQHWQAVGERLERLETQVQAIGKLIVVGVIGGAVAYMLNQRAARAQLALGPAPVAEGDQAPDPVQVGPAGAEVLISDDELAELAGARG